MYHLKRTETHTAHCGKGLKSEQAHPRATDSLNLTRHNLVKVTNVTRPLLTPVAQVRIRCIQ
jgi:hypothetical protein